MSQRQQFRSAAVGPIVEGGALMGARSRLMKSHGDAFAWSLLDAAPDATLIVAPSGEIVFANDHAGLLFGTAPADLIGEVIEDLLPQSLRAVHRAHRNRYRAEPAVRTMGADLKLHARRGDGSEFPVEVSLSPLDIDDEVHTVAAVRDISARLATEDHLRRVIDTLDATDEGVFIFDTESLRYSFVNAGAVRLSGYSEDELLSMTPMHLNPYASRSEYRRLVDSLLSDDTPMLVRQSVLLRKDGTEIAIEKTLRVAPEESDGNRWVITLTRDIRDRLWAEADLRASQAELATAHEHVAVSDDRERIARDLHDTVIQRLFAAGLHINSTMTTLDDTHRTRSRLEETVDGLDIAIRDLRNAIFSMHTRQTTPSGLRGQILTIVNESSEGLGFDPRVQFDGTVDASDVASGDHLLAVLRESLANISRHARATHVRVAVVATDGLTLTISDDGIGMPEDVVGGHGIENMTERAHQLGGTFRCEAVATGGTCSTWHVPVPSGA